MTQPDRPRSLPVHIPLTRTSRTNRPRMALTSTLFAVVAGHWARSFDSHELDPVAALVREHSVTEPTACADCGHTPRRPPTKPPAWRAPWRRYRPVSSASSPQLAKTIRTPPHGCRRWMGDLHRQPRPVGGVGPHGWRTRRGDRQLSARSGELPPPLGPNQPRRSKRALTAPRSKPFKKQLTPRGTTRRCLPSKQGYMERPRRRHGGVDRRRVPVPTSSASKAWTGPRRKMQRFGRLLHDA